MLLNCLGNVSVNSIPAYERRSSRSLRAGFPRAHCRVTAPISVWWPDERWSEPERSAPSRKATGSGHRRTYSLTKVCNWTFMSAIFHRSWDPPFKKAYFPPAGASFVAVEVDSVLLPLLVSELARLVRWCVDLTATPSFFFGQCHINKGHLRLRTGMGHYMFISRVWNWFFRLKRMNLLEKMLVTIENEGGWGEAQVAASRLIYIHNKARQIDQKQSFRTAICDYFVYSVSRFVNIARMESADFTGGSFAQVSLLALKNGVNLNVISGIQPIEDCEKSVVWLLGVF